MNMIIDAANFPYHVRGVCDGTATGTRFYDASGEELFLADITVQQEGLSSVRVRFAQKYGIRSLAIGPEDTLIINLGVDA